MFISDVQCYLTENNEYCADSRPACCQVTTLNKLCLHLRACRSARGLVGTVFGTCFD